MAVLWDFPGTPVPEEELDQILAVLQRKARTNPEILSIQKGTGTAEIIYHTTEGEVSCRLAQQGNQILGISSLSKEPLWRGDKGEFMAEVAQG